MKIQFKVPDIKIYHELFHSLGCTGSPIQSFYDTCYWFNISDDKQLEGNTYPKDKYQTVSIKEAIEFCVTGKWPQPKLYTFDELNPGDRFIYVGSDSNDVFEKLDVYLRGQRIVRMKDGKYTIISNSAWIEHKTLKKVD